MPCTNFELENQLLTLSNHTETMCQNSYMGFNQNQGKPGGIIHCCASVCFCFDLGCNYTVQTILLILVIVSVCPPPQYKVGKTIDILPEIGFFPGMLEEGPLLVPLPGCTGEPWHDCELSASKVHQLDLPVPSFWTRTNLLCSERLCRIEFWNEKDTRSSFKIC